MMKPPKHPPIDPEVQEEMRTIGRSIADGLPPGWGFCLLVFQFGPEGNTNYISNAHREDMIKALEEFVANAKAGEVRVGTPNKKKGH